MAKTIDFTIKERISAVGLLNNGKFNNVTLGAVLEDLKKIAMTDEEWTAANLTKTPTDEEVKAIIAENPNAQVPQNYRWDEVNKDIELNTATIDALLQIIKEKSDANELTLEDAPLVALQAKLEAE